MTKYMFQSNSGDPKLSLHGCHDYISINTLWRKTHPYRHPTAEKVFEPPNIYTSWVPINRVKYGAINTYNKPGFFTPVTVAIYVRPFIGVPCHSTNITGFWTHLVPIKHLKTHRWQRYQASDFPSIPKEFCRSTVLRFTPLTNNEWQWT